MSLPGYWMNETSGVLSPAIEAYLNNRPMDREQIAAMRAYLRQWIMAPGWIGPEVEALRKNVNWLFTREAISMWLDAAMEEGIDPL